MFTKDDLQGVSPAPGQPQPPHGHHLQFAPPPGPMSRRGTQVRGLQMRPRQNSQVNTRYIYLQEGKRLCKSRIFNHNFFSLSLFSLCQSLRQVGGGPGQLRGGPLLQGRAGGQLLGDHEAAAVELEGQDLRWAKPGDKLVSSLKHIN